MPSKSNKNAPLDSGEVKTKQSKKVIDEEDRIRRRVEIEQLRKEEEEQSNRLEAIRLEKSHQKGQKKKKGGINAAPSIIIPAGLESEKDIEDKKKKQNQLKNSKKKTKEAARRKQLEAEVANAKKVSSSISNAPLEHNFNHTTFFNEKNEEEGDDDSHVDSTDNVVTDEKEKDIYDDVEEEDEGEKHGEEEEDDEFDDNFVIVTKDLECVSPKLKYSPASVLVDADSTPPPPLDLGTQNKKNKKGLKGLKKKDKNKKSLEVNHGSVNESSNNNNVDNKCIMSSKKQAKEAMKVAYAAFEAKVLPSLKEENPLLRNKDHRAQAAKMWLRSPENPNHPNHALFLAHNGN